MHVKKGRVDQPAEYGDAANFWVEYPSGLVDLTRSHHLSPASTSPPDVDRRTQLEVPIDGARTVRVLTQNSAIVVIDMQNFFLHPNVREHPKGLACVEPLLKLAPALRAQGLKILWVNWGLTEHELKTIPPALARSFSQSGRGGFGAAMPGNFGRLLMRDSYNAELYGPLQAEYLKGREQGTDVWIHKNRISGLWGYQSALDLYLQETGIKTLFFAGVNADQCVAGTVYDAYFRGYDVILIEDCVATTSPDGGLENVLYNVGNSYGFVTDSTRIVEAVEISSG